MTHAFTPAARNTITDIQSAACEQPSGKHMFSLTITNAMLNVINPNVPFPAPYKLAQLIFHLLPVEQPGSVQTHQLVCFMLNVLTLTEKAKQNAWILL